jgi:uncharacterized protein (DUF58 family)
MQITLQDISDFKNLDLLARQLVEGFITGLHKSPYHGFSVEFAEHKLYNFGESTRYIDWKVFARTDRLYTKQFEEETNLRCQIILDQSASMYYPIKGRDKIKFAVLCAASIAHLLIKQRDAVGLMLFSGELDDQSQQKSTSVHLHQLLQTLGKVLEVNDPKGKTDIAGVLNQIATSVPRRSLIVLFTDMFHDQDLEPVFSAMQHLRHNLNEVIVFHVSDHRTELAFDFPDRPTQFVDVESGEKVRLNPHQVRDAYQSFMQQTYKEIRLRCGSMGIDFVEVDTHMPFNKILGEFLIKRMRMR